MKHISYSDKSVLVGDEAADVLVEYAAAIARIASADSITLAAKGSDGDEVDATFLLTSGTILMAETTTSTSEEPDNSGPITYMRERLAAIISPSQVTAEKPSFDEPELDDNHAV